jgi:hypothetical protein
MTVQPTRPSLRAFAGLQRLGFSKARARMLSVHTP